MDLLVRALGSKKERELRRMQENLAREREMAREPIRAPIYRFAPEIYDALISQPLTGDLPTDCLYHLPEWAVYSEFSYSLYY